MRLADTTSRSASAIKAINRYLLPREQSRITVRQHPAVLAGPFITAVAGLAAAAIVAQVVSPGHQVLLAAVWLAWGLLLLRAVQKAAAWSVDYFVVTSDRILMVTGVVSRRVAIIPFSLVNNFSCQRSPAGRLLGYGEFVVQYGARDQVRQRLQYLPYPEQLYQEIRQVLYPAAEAHAPDEEPAGDDQET